MSTLLLRTAATAVAAVRSNNVLILNYLLLITICNGPDDDRKTETGCPVTQ